MFTSNAHNAKYVFLLTNSDPNAPKHKNLTMFLVPLDSPGIDIQAIRTIDGDRTNIVFYSDVRVDDRYRIGAVNGGWAVLRGALDVEHGTVEAEDDGLQRVAVMSEHVTLMAEAIDAIGALVTQRRADGRRLLDDTSVAYRLGRSVARTEAALSTPGMFGRVANAQTMRDVAPDLMDLLGSASALPIETEGAADGADNGGAEYIFRLASPVGIYGGTLEVFRNMIAQHALGLGRPSYSPPKS
jgi:alkylation response protein AidB-like acyl-CoA dehydrogenase